MRTLGIMAILLAAGSARAEGEQVDVLSEAAMRSHAGDHLGASQLYEQAYRTNHDVDLLPILGSEYRVANKPLEAIQNFCAYLAVEPAGPSAAFAASQVRAIRAERGSEIADDRDVCLQVASVDTISHPGMTPEQTPIPAPRTPVAASAGWSKRELAGAGTALLGLVSLGAGLYFHHEARSISDQLTNHDPSLPWPENIRELQQRGQSYQNEQLILLTTGSVALVTAGVLYFTGRSARTSSERLSVAPVVSPSTAGLAISRGF